MWAVWTAEGSDYLKELDAAVYPSGPVSPAPNPGLVDISHARWATTNAITAIDLCAATIGRVFCGHRRARELDLRDFDPAACSSRSQAKVADRRASLQQDFQDVFQWVDGTLTDKHYVELHDARNPFTHSWLRQHHFGGTENRGHVDRTQFEVIDSGHQTNARKMVVDSASLALDRVRKFVEVVDRY